MKKYFSIPVLLLAIIIFCPQAVKAQVSIDGNFFDWNSSMRVDIAPNSVEKTFAEGILMHRIQQILLTLLTWIFNTYMLLMILIMFILVSKWITLRMYQK